MYPTITATIGYYIFRAILSLLITFLAMMLLIWPILALTATLDNQTTERIIGGVATLVFLFFTFKRHD